VVDYSQIAKPADYPSRLQSDQLTDFKGDNFPAFGPTLAHPLLFSKRQIE
jgi:hypothetical protein